MSFSQITIIGNVGRDPEIRRMDDGSVVANFSVAVNDKTTRDGQRRETTHWFNVDVWQAGEKGLVDIVSRYVLKGTQLMIQGRPICYKWRDKEGNERDGFRIRLSGPSAQLRLLGGARREEAQRDDGERVDPETGEVLPPKPAETQAGPVGPEPPPHGEDPRQGKPSQAHRRSRQRQVTSTEGLDDEVPF